MNRLGWLLKEASRHGKPLSASTAAEADQAFRELNAMLDKWSGQPLVLLAAGKPKQPLKKRSSAQPHWPRPRLR